MPFVIVALTLFAAFKAVEASTETNATRLAKMFSPILILTEETGGKWGDIIVTKPEPVGIMGATSGGNIWFDILAHRRGNWTEIHSTHLRDQTWFNPTDVMSNERTWDNGQNRIKLLDNKFAFFNGLGSLSFTPTAGSKKLKKGEKYLLVDARFEFSGEGTDGWNAEYRKIGEDFPNTAYVHIYKRVVDQYEATYDSVTVIQYHYFYPYNDWWNDHEGDWPQIDVVVSSSNPTTATILGVEYRFHGAWLNYYKGWNTEPGLTTNFEFNPRTEISLSPGPTRKGIVQYTHPIVYVGAGSHGSYPVGGNIQVYRNLTGASEDGAPKPAVGGDFEHMTHTGLVLSTGADGTHSELWERYDLQLLPEPDLSDNNNMGLADTLSWLGARIRWGTVEVGGIGGNESPKRGPYNSNKDSWGNLKFFKVGKTGPEKLSHEMHHKDLPYSSYHHWAIIGNETWSGTVPLTGDVVIFPGATLTIKPGTVVEFNPGKDRHEFSPASPATSNDDLIEIFVYGTLKAEGKSGSPITFQKPSTSTWQGAYAWGGIRKMSKGTVNLNSHTRIMDAPAFKVAFNAPSYGMFLSNGTEEVMRTVPVTVEMTPAPDLRALTIPITVKAIDAEPGDYKVIGLTSGALTFDVANGTQSFTVTGLPDADFDNDRVALGFGALPDEVVAGEQATATVTITDHGTTPPTPKTLTTDPHTGNLLIKWDPVEAHPEVTGYELEYQSQAGIGGTPPWTSWTGLAALAADATNHTHRELSYPTRYRYRLRATNARGDGAWSEALPKYGESPYPVGLVTRVEEVFTFQNNELVVVLACPLPEPELCGHLAELEFGRLATYEFQLNGGEWQDGGSLGEPGVSGASEGSQASSELTVTVDLSEDLDPTRRHKLKLRLKTPDGTTSAASEAVWLIPLRAQASTDGGAVALNWDALPRSSLAVTGWEVRYRSGTSEWGAWQEVPKTGRRPRHKRTSYTVDGLTSGKSYEFQVRAVDSQTLRASSFVASATLTAVVAAPSTPGNLQAFPGDGRVFLTWAAADSNGSTIRRYRVRYVSADGQTKSRWTPVVGGNTAREHTVKGLSNGTTYTFKVKARNGIGSGKLAEVEATPQLLPVPEGRSAVSGWTQVELSWSPVPLTPVLSGYDLQEQSKPVSGGTWPATWTDLLSNEAGTLKNDRVSHTHNSLDPDRVYRYRVRSMRGEEMSAWSALLPGAAGVQPRPGPVTGVSAVAGDGQIALGWTGPSHTHITGWSYRSGTIAGQDTTWAVWGPMSGSTTSTRAHTVKNLTNGTAYTFQVRAVNGGGDGAPSKATEAARPAAAKEDLSSPSNGQAVSGWGQVGVSWSPVRVTPAVSGYDLQGQSKPVSGGTWPARWTDLLSNGSGTFKNSRISHTHASLDPDRKYRYRVRSVRGEEASAWSDTLPTVAGVQPRPGRVTGLTTSRGDQEVNLAWTGPVHTHVTGWKVRSGAIAEQDTTWAVWSPISGSTASTRAHTVKNLTNGTAYMFQVRAVNGGGDGAPSKPTGSVTPAGVPGPPGDLMAAPGKKMKMALSWSAPSSDNGSAITEYEVRRSSDGGTSWGSWTETESTSPSHTVNSLSSGAYSFQVRAKNGVGEGTTSRQATGAWFLENGTQAAVSYPSGPGQVWTLAGADAGDFSISRGTLSFASAPDYEDPVDADTDNVYRVRVEARDPGPSTPSLRVEVTVRVTGVEEKGQVTLSSVAPQAGTRLQATLSDPDGGETDPLWFWDRSSSSLSGQSDEDEEEGGPRDYYTPGAGDVGKKLRARVSYTDDHGAGLDHAQSVWTTAVIGVPCAPKNLSASAGNAQVTLSWSAPDCDGGSAITKYEYKRGSGDWSTASGGGSARSQTVTKLTNGTAYTFSVRAVNKVGGGAEASKSATPRTLVISGPSAPSFAENGTGHVATYSMTGHGAATVTWSLEGTDKDQLKLNGSGRLTFRSAPDYEDPTDADSDNAYEVRVKAVAGLLEKTKSVTVRVTGVEEGGQVTLSSVAPQVGTRLQATLNDSDGGETVKFWFWDRSKAQDQAQGEEQGGPRDYYTPQAGDVGKKLRARVSYTDDHGAGLDHAQSVWTAAVIGVPCAPKTLSAAAGNGQVTLSWSAPDCDGGSAITKYEYKQGKGDWSTVSGGGSARSLTVTKLTNGTAYTFSVRAVNKVGAGAEASKSATPRTLVISGPSAPSFAENGTGHVAAYTASGHGTTTVTWSLEGTDKDQLKLDGSGRLTFRSVPDYEAAVDADGDNGYEVRVKAVAGTLEKTKSVTVRVTGVEEGGQVTLSSSTPQVGTRLQATLSDPDGGETVKFWFWDRSKAQAQAQGQQGEEQGGPRDYYTPRAGDVGKKLRARVSYTDDHGAGLDHAQSAYTAAVIGTPCAPKNLSAAAGNGRVTLSWSAPGCDGGSAITKYEYKQSSGSWSTVSGGGSARSKTVTGLTNGTAYTFSVRAVNGVGSGASASKSAMPRTLVISGSSAPSFAENGTGHVAAYSASGHGTTTVTWSLEGVDAGELTIDGSGRLTFRSAPDYEDPDDADGDNVYDVRVKAVTGSLEKTKEVAVRVTGVEEKGQVTLSSTAPQVGTRLQATLSDPDDGETVRFWFWDRSTASLSGQSDEGGPRDYYTPQAGDVGKKLRARVSYTDNHGSNQDNAQSAWTSAVIGTPCAPKNLQTSVGNGRVTLRWSTPDCDGGSAITKYEYKQDSGDWSTVSGGGSARSKTVTGLRNGTRYTFSVRAVNGVGTGASSSKSATPAGLPGRPGLSATAGSGSVTLRWSAAASNGSAITKYEYKRGSGSWSTVSGGGSARSKTVTGLTNGTRYTFSVRAVNGVGAGASSSKSVTPAGLPGRPGLSATAGRGSVTLRWSAASTNGSAITKYEYKRGSGNWSTVSGGGSARSKTVTGLRNGTRYTFSVRAVNGVGAGAASSKSVTPASEPGRPSLSATAGSGRVTLRWSAASTNGSAITKYEYKRGSGNWSTVSGGASARSKTVTGLRNGTRYTFYVRAVNGVGAGSAASASMTPAGVPGAPQSLRASTGIGRVTLTWGAASSNGSAITKYEYRRGSGGWSTVSGGASARRQTVTGLTGGFTYTFYVRAVNGVGAGASASRSAIPIDDFALKSNHPNPFNAETRLHYALPAAQWVRLTIYDMLGRVVRTLVDQEQPPGWHQVIWDGRDESGREVASGIYFYRFQTPKFAKTRKMILLR